MTQLEYCGHCNFAIPSDAATCPGCGRRHRIVESDAPRRIPALAHHLGLLGPANRARRLIVLSGWCSAVFGLAAAACYIVSLHEVADQVSDDVPGRVIDAAERLGWLALAVSGLAAAAVVLWERRAQSNLTALHLEPDWRSPWSLAGWAVPGRMALEQRRIVDAQWRDTHVAVAPLPSGRGGWSRRPVSRVVIRWWAVWLWVPALAVLLVVLFGAGFDRVSGAEELELAAVAASALLVVALRSTYDVIGVVTVAQAHRGEALLRQQARLDEVVTAPARHIVPPHLHPEDLYRPLPEEALPEPEPADEVAEPGPGEPEPGVPTDEGDDEVNDVNDLAAYDLSDY